MSLPARAPLNDTRAPRQLPTWRALFGLSRWREHVPFTLAATVLGIDMAADYHARRPDEQALIVTAACILAVTFAFMINDIEDAPDDARDPARRTHNVIATGTLSSRDGYVAAAVTAFVALGLFSLLRPEAMACGVLIVLLSWLYSWRPVRLKAWPVVDVISHVLMLSTLLFLSGYLAVDPSPGSAWMVAVAVGFISAYGQLYNQVRDFAADRAANLRNTASLLGIRATTWVMYACLGTAILLLGWSVRLGLWPTWLVIPIGATVPLLRWYRGGVDMRGTAAIDLSGQLQLAAMIGADVVVVCWLIVLLIR